MVAITYGVAGAAVSANKDAAQKAQKGLLARIYDVIVAARTRQAEREIRKHLYLARGWQQEYPAAKDEKLPFGR